MHNSGDTANQSMRGQRAYPLAASILLAARVYRRGETVEDPLTPSQHPHIAPLSLHQTKPSKRRITIKETEDYPQAAAHTLTPSQAL